MHSQIWAKPWHKGNLLETFTLYAYNVYCMCQSLILLSFSFNSGSKSKKYIKMKAIFSLFKKLKILEQKWKDNGSEPFLLVKC